MRRLLMTAAAIALSVTTAQAAQIWVNPAEGHGHVIHIKGDIEHGDANQFANIVGNAGVRPNDATIYLDSPGGFILEGITIARAIRKYGWSTYVGKDMTCASMCAGIWLAGKARFVHEDGHVGFHSTNSDKQKGKRDEYGNALMFAFYRELGVSDKAARVFLAAEPGDDAIWLTEDLAKSLEITAVTIPDEAPKEAPKPKAPDKVSRDTLPDRFVVASAAEPQLPARDAGGDTGPPPVKPSDLAPVKPGDLSATPQSEPSREHHERAQPRRRYVGGGRSCSFSVPLPYIGGITIRGRC